MRIKELGVRAYQDNEGVVRVAFTSPQPVVEEAMRQLDQDRQDRELAEKLISLDAIWAATPMDDAFGLADKLHEVTRDAELEIRRQRDRTSQMALCAAIGWTIAVSVAILWWLS